MVATVFQPLTAVVAFATSSSLKRGELTLEQRLAVVAVRNAATGGCRGKGAR